MSDEYRFAGFHALFSFFSFPLFRLSAKTNGTCLIMRVILQTARASIFHVNHSGVDRDCVFHQSLLQARVNCVQGCQPPRGQHQVNGTLPLFRPAQALIYVDKGKPDESCPWEIESRPHPHVLHKPPRTTPCSPGRSPPSNLLALHPQ